MPADPHDKTIRLFQIIGTSVILLNLLAYLIFGKEVLQATVVVSLIAIILFVIVKAVSS